MLWQNPTESSVYIQLREKTRRGVNALVTPRFYGLKTRKGTGAGQVRRVRRVQPAKPKSKAADRVSGDLVVKHLHPFVWTFRDPPAFDGGNGVGASKPTQRCGVLG